MANEFNIKNGFISNGDGSVNGRLITQNLTITSGATNGYVLTSDSNGNATWQVPTDTNFANTDLTFTGNRNHDTNGNDLYIYNGLGLDGFGPNINSISIGDPRVAIGYGYYLNNISLDIGVYNGNTGFTFTTQGVERIRINNSGNLGIGTTSPSEKLDVSGKTKTTNFQMTSGATNGYILTSDASGNAIWSSIYKKETVNIDSATILGTLSTGGTIQLLPAPSVGKYYDWHAFVKYTYGTVAYNNSGAGSWYVEQGGADLAYGFNLNALTTNRTWKASENSGGAAPIGNQGFETSAITIGVGSALTNGDGTISVDIYYRELNL